MANRFSPTVLPRAPQTRARGFESLVAPAGRLLKAFMDHRKYKEQQEEERALRETLIQGGRTTDELAPDEGFGATLGRAATAARSRGYGTQGPTELGAFDPQTGQFRHPDITTPDFNPYTDRSPVGGFGPLVGPNAPNPYVFEDGSSVDPEVWNQRVMEEELRATGRQRRSGVEEVSSLGRAGAGLEQIPLEETPRAMRADRAVDNYLVEHGNTETLLEDYLGRQKEGRKLSRAIGALRRAGASPEDIALLEAGVLDEEGVLDRMDTEDAELEKELNNRAAWQQLRQLDPDTYGQYVEGADYATELFEVTGDRRMLDRQEKLEDVKHRNRMEEIAVQEAGKNRRASMDNEGGGLGKRGKERRDSFEKELGPPQTESEQIALDLLAQGQSPEEILAQYDKDLVDAGASLDERVQLGGQLEGYLLGLERRRRTLGSEAPDIRSPGDREDINSGI